MSRRLPFALVALLGLAPLATAANIVVSPGSPNGWTGYSTDSSGALNTGSATADFTNGPASPPLGTGSGHLQTAPGAGDGSAQFRTTNFAGTKLSAITSLGYSTYASAWNGQQLPYLTMWIDTNNDNTADNRLHFEPDYTAPALLNTWQNWDALNGQWYDDNGLLGSGPGSDTKTFAALAAALGTDATIVNAAPGIGGFRLTSGFASAGDNFNTNIDAVTLGTAAGSTTYDFEAAAVPTPAAAAGGLALLGSLVGARRSRAASR